MYKPILSETALKRPSRPNGGISVFSHFEHEHTNSSHDPILPGFWLQEPLDGSTSRKPAPRPIWAQKPEFLVEIALSRGPTELARVQAKQGFGLSWAGTLKRENAILGPRSQL